jgi:hypothetical protein
MKFEFLPAFKGDCFLIHAGTAAKPFLILVDGGPGGTYEQHLRPHLLELRDERGLDGSTPLVIDLVIVSHVDDDHINGIIGLFRELFDAARSGQPPLFKVKGLWHNSFDEIIGNNQINAEVAQFGTASLASMIEEAANQVEFDASLILQSIAQGNELRDLASSIELNIPLNDGFGGLIKTANNKLTKRKIGGITFTIIGPRTAELKALQKKHDDWLKEQKAKGKLITPGSMLQAMADESVANLSSIVLLAERDGRRALLTGDARGDFILKGAEEIGLVEAGKPLAVDLLKMPHHGSDRNVDVPFLKRVRAAQYLFTGNGEHGNPERETFEMLQTARPTAAMELFLTYKIATIDPEREKTHAKERKKAIAKDKPAKRKWSKSKDSLEALFAALPGNIKVIQPTGPVVEL